MSEIARNAIKEHFKGDSKQESGAGMLLRWAQNSKNYKSSHKDENLSTTYKEYLYGSKSVKFGHLWKKNT